MQAWVGRWINLLRATGYPLMERSLSLIEGIGNASAG